MKINKMFAAALLMSTLIGCAKDNEIEPSKAELIAGKNWMMTYSTYRFGDGPEASGFDETAPCGKDDIAVFYRNGRFEQNEGATKCQENLPQVFIQGAWFILGDTLNMHINVGTGPLFTAREKILELTEEKLVTESLPYPSEGDSAMIVKVTYTAM